MRQDQTTAILDIPEPLVHATPTGLFVEWHARGLNIEVRVRDGRPPWVVIEDVRGAVQSYQGSDNGAVGRALSALCIMEGRHG